MSANVCSNLEKTFINKSYDRKIQHPINSMPKDIFIEIFADFSLAELGTMHLVSKKWKQLAGQPLLWKRAIYREIAFGTDQWAACFGADVVKEENRDQEFVSLPWKRFIKDCQKFQKIFPLKKAKDTLLLVRVPKTLNGRLTLKSLQELSKKYFKDSPRGGYRSWWVDVQKNLADKSIDKSKWILMTTDVLPQSRNKSYAEQKQIIKNLNKQFSFHYTVPGLLESVVCILSQYFAFNKRLFNTDPWTHTRCKQKIKIFQTIAGAFSVDGLILACAKTDAHSIGIAAMKKFS